jgi:hypothetical protein
MDASQYKDYVLVLLFIKYISDKYADVPDASISIPTGAGFKDLVALKETSDIGDQINKKIIAPLANANKLSDFPDFNDAFSKKWKTTGAPWRAGLHSYNFCRVHKSLRVTPAMAAGIADHVWSVGKNPCVCKSPSRPRTLN